MGNETFTIFESKKYVRGSAYDFLPLERIGPVPEDRPETGPIQGILKYKEGYCFKIFTDEPIGTPREIWLICLENKNDAQELYENFLWAKINYQQKVGDVINAVSDSTDLTERKYINIIN